MKKVKRDFLSAEELNRIYHKRFSSKRLTLVKSIFIFSRYTGLAYFDVKGLKIDYLQLTSIAKNRFSKTRYQVKNTSITTCPRNYSKI
ncbi:MAG: hypothetical protein ACI9XR_001623 [Flavobacterium sp.]|jgi:hypothetical protein